jgi:hypothetical protein
VNDPAAAERAVREFLAREASLLGPERGELRLNPSRSGSFEGGRIRFFDFDWLLDGVPVEGARIFLHVNHGNVIQFGSEGVGPAPASLPFRLTSEQAATRAFDHAGGRRAGDLLISDPARILLPLPGRGSAGWGEGIEYRPAWRVAFRRGEAHPTWTAEVDARTGEILAFYDANAYARVVGGVQSRTPNDPEEKVPFPRSRVTHGEVVYDTGDTATYLYQGGPVFTALDGTFFRPVCIDCQNPERAFAFAREGTGDLDLGTGGADGTGNGFSTPAERSVFYHLNRIRALAKKWLANSWFETTVGANVNIVDVCNAFWDGSTVNFFRSGGGCTNTGQSFDVIAHEWGHGLDQNTNLGDGSTGEATGDITSMHATHDARMGPFFETNGNPVRDLESSRVGYVARISNLGSFCVDCSAQGLPCTDGPGGHEVHCEGEIYGQAHWDLAKLLIAKHGFATGWQVLERIYFLSLPQATTFFPGQGGNVYNAYLAVDDDNGNLADGTPNCAEIHAAFSAHEIANGPPCAGSTPGCARPAQPVVTASGACGRVLLDWNAVPGGVLYRVLRADFDPALAYIPLGTTTGTHFEDATVQPGMVHHYVVEAETATGCRSTIENPVAGAAASSARPSVEAFVLSDIPAGNRSGFADPGESVDPTLTLGNPLPSDAAPGPAANLTSLVAGVGATTPGATWPAIPAGGTAPGTAFRVALDGGVACGVQAEFALSIADGSGCATTPGYISFPVGERVLRFEDDFETDTGWTVATGGPTVANGRWVRDDPVGTNWQPEFDATPGPGTRCWFTGQNTSDGSGDVDGGTTVLLSPVIDLSGAAAARLSYRRWWGNSAPGADPGDFFRVDVSGDGGATWFIAKSATSQMRSLAWQPVEVRLEPLVPLNNQFRIRVRVADGTPSGALVEGAIDDIRVEGLICDPTPPCFVEPDFSGLATLSPGASCAEADLGWSPASTNCANAAVSYNVYRSTAPDFTPGPSSLVAPGVAGTGYHDTLLTPGVTYHYLVRAEDSRSGEDSNLTRLPLTATSSPDTVPPVFAGLAAVATGGSCGEVVLGWAPAAETCSAPARYDVFRSTTPGFVPGPSNRVASVLSAGFVDTALVPDQSYFYVVRAVDAAGNTDGNLVEGGAASRILPRLLYHQDFEAGDGGWSRIAPDDAVTGRWEWGDPEGTGVQPEDDATPSPGSRAWITGLAALGGAGGNDVDAGTTTLASPNLDLSTASSPVLGIALFFSNELGANPGEDPFRVDVSGDGGSSWVSVLNTTAPLAAWDFREFPLAGLVPFNTQFRIRVTAQDLGVGGSLVEAGVDGVTLLQPDEGCLGCPAPADPVGTIQASRSGDDIVIDWSADPVAAVSYNVYLLSGPGFSQWVRAGSTPSKTFVHPGAAQLTNEDFFYRVSAVDACGAESPLN